MTGNSVGMDYTQLFRSLREAKGLTLEQLSTLARVHRNTIINIESGRPVKFKTIAALMQKMGYSGASAEMRSMALLWLESISGIPFSRAESSASAKKTISSYRSSARLAARHLADSASDANLTPDQIQLLIFAIKNPGVISIIEQVRDLAADLSSGEEASKPQLLAAEDRPGSR